MDIEGLIPKVIASMKINQQVRPTVYAQFEGGSVQTYAMMHFMGDSRTKAHLLFVRGREVGQTLTEFELAETCFVAEIWLTPESQRNPNPGQRPPANVPHIEAVMLALARNAAPFETLVKVYRIRRDKQSKVKELVFLNENVDPEGLMGLAFTAGWRSRSMSDAEVQALQPQGMRAFLKEG